jgi:hypothetical protein
MFLTGWAGGTKAIPCEVGLHLAKCRVNVWVEADLIQLVWGPQRLQQARPTVLNGSARELNAVVDVSTSTTQYVRLRQSHACSCATLPTCDSTMHSLTYTLTLTSGSNVCGWSTLQPTTHSSHSAYIIT